MGYLIDAWKRSQEKFHMTMKQVVFSAGDGSLQNDDSVQELRDFYTLIDLDTMGRLLGECISKDKKYKFDERPYAFQDLVNEMGKRLGYEVENGLYKGRRHEIGFDGLWKTKDGSYIIMESKTSDDYSMAVDSVIGYRDKLIVEHRVPKKKCAILIVYGRDDKGALRNTVKGSDEAKNIRLISANALFQLVKIYSSTQSPVTEKQINNLLVPKDYFVLDNLVELVFPETDDDIPEIVDTEEEENEKSLHSGKGEKGESRNSSESGTNMGIEKSQSEDGRKVKCIGKSTDTEAQGIYYSDGRITVLKGSRVSDRKSATFPKKCKGYYKTRCEYEKDGTIENRVLQKDCDFVSLSEAASIVLGRSANGRTAWVLENGDPVRKILKK